MSNLVTDKQFNLLVNHLDAPFKEKVTVSEAFDYLREEYSHKIVFEICVTTYRNLVRYMYRVREYLPHLGTYEQVAHGVDYETHPLAESALLTAVLNYLMKKEK